MQKEEIPVWQEKEKFKRGKGVQKTNTTDKVLVKMMPTSSFWQILVSIHNSDGYYLLPAILGSQIPMAYSANPAGTRQGSDVPRKWKQILCKLFHKYLAQAGHVEGCAALLAAQTCGAGWDCWSKTSGQKQSLVNESDCCLVSQVMSVTCQTSPGPVPSVKARPRQDAQPLVLVCLTLVQCWWICHIPGDSTPVADWLNCEEVSSCD